MNKKLSFILSSVFGIGVLVLIYIFYRQIQSESTLQSEINRQEDLVKQKLNLFGQLQKAKLERTGSFAKNFDELKDFVMKEKLYEISRKETVKELYLGRDTVIFSYDTLKTISIVDSIWSKTPFDIRQFEYVPANEINPEESRMFQFKAAKLGESVFFEIIDPKPINPSRVNGELDTLRVGSLKILSADGNWN